MHARVGRGGREQPLAAGARRPLGLGEGQPGAGGRNWPLWSLALWSSRGCLAARSCGSSSSNLVHSPPLKIFGRCAELGFPTCPDIFKPALNIYSGYINRLYFAPRSGRRIFKPALFLFNNFAFLLLLQRDVGDRREPRRLVQFLRFKPALFWLPFRW